MLLETTNVNQVAGKIIVEMTFPRGKKQQQPNLWLQKIFFLLKQTAKAAAAMYMMREECRRSGSTKYVIAFIILCFPLA